MGKGLVTAAIVPPKNKGDEIRPPGFPAPLLAVAIQPTLDRTFDLPKGSGVFYRVQVACSSGGAPKLRAAPEICLNYSRIMRGSANRSIAYARYLT
jgi:hypothetical protein